MLGELWCEKGKMVSQSRESDTMEGGIPFTSPRLIAHLNAPDRVLIVELIR